jgi:hypothetical protein
MLERLEGEIDLDQDRHPSETVDGIDKSSLFQLVE